MVSARFDSRVKYLGTALLNLATWPLDRLYYSLYLILIQSSRKLALSISATGYSVHFLPLLSSFSFPLFYPSSPQSSLKRSSAIAVFFRLTICPYYYYLNYSHAQAVFEYTCISRQMAILTIFSADNFTRPLI